jgi:transcriptional regulator with PAS, ATPase and Fis domain
MPDNQPIRAELRIPAGYTLAEVIDHAIRISIKRHGSKRKAAKALKIAEKTIYNRLGTATSPR